MFFRPMLSPGRVHLRVDGFGMCPGYREGACVPCPDKTFTAAPGATSRKICQALQVRVLGSVHRVWIGMHADAK